jgi:DNA-binding HxlR family transcriptional regulator
MRTEGRIERGGGQPDDGAGPICAHFRRAAAIVGRRWNPEILRVLLARGPVRYRDLKAAIPGISDHLLSGRLKSLEDEGILTRSVTPDGPVRVEYALTEAGRDLAGPIGELAAWAERWASRT